MMNDLTGMEGRKLRMPSVSPLRVMGRVTGRQRGWALGINTIPFHFPATAFPVEMATPQPTNLSSTVRGDDNLRLSFERGSYQGGYRLADYEQRGLLCSLCRILFMTFKEMNVWPCSVWHWLWFTVYSFLHYESNRAPEVRLRFEIYHIMSLSSVLPENVILPTIEHNNTKHLNTKVYNDTLHYMYITL